ncbi:MAG: PEGA domain-containing protein [Deltaproteobacteria bacterium]|nr:PEGA domain-containing protein [Deltaproteobacteria bacterium]
MLVLLCAPSSRGQPPAAPPAGPPGPTPHVAPAESGAPTLPAPSPPGEAGAAGPEAREAELAEAKRLFRQGNDLRQAGDPQRALELFMRSRALVASVPNTLNAAICLALLGRDDEALELYEVLITEFRGELLGEERERIAPEMARLRARVGNLDVQANVEGSLVVDGRARGRLPLLTPVRVLPGRRLVRVMAQGYRSFEAVVDVAVGRTVTLDARLDPLAVAGRLRLDDARLTGAEIYVDGALVGTAPWEGALAPGTHRLVARRGELGCAPREVVVIEGQTVRSAPPLSPLGRELRLLAKPPTAELLIGDVSVGTGRWQGRLPLGAYRIEAREEGYLALSRELRVDAETGGDLPLVLPVDERHPRWGVRAAGRLWAEAFGGLAVAPTLASGAEASCASAVFECSDDPAALGLLVGARAGYEFPFRLSVELAGGYLQASKTLGRSAQSSFQASSTSEQVVPTSYDLSDELHLSGPLALLGLGYRVPFSRLLELRAHLLVGALYAFARDAVGGTAAAGGRSAPVDVVGAGATVESADLLVLPELSMGLRLGDVGLSAGIAAPIFALEGPRYEHGDVQVVGDTSGCHAAPTAIECARAQDLLRDERAYGPFVMILPSLAAGYAF